MRSTLGKLCENLSPLLGIIFSSKILLISTSPSAFPDISLDGSGDIPLPAAPAQSGLSKGTFTWDSFDTRDPAPNVVITGDNVIEKFEDQFPDIDVPQICPPSFSSSIPCVFCTYNSDRFEC
jgi:hypothetical protein